LRDRANKDILTLLPNRPAICEILQQELSRCHRDRRTVGVILLDLDHFKRINDTYGHFAGDAVLKETANRLRGNMRPYDRIGRYGGEEFLVVLPNCDLEQAAQQAERMREKLEQQPMYVDGAELQVTASFGVTISDGSGRSPDYFIRVADGALYQAKHAGRNRVATLLPENPEKPVLA
jgi:diguanylate cyclase (GGDEF)-like protein